jgi:uncharacterized protein YbbC (DUF1343 family)
MQQLKTGLDVLLASRNVEKWGSIGLVTNDAARTAAGTLGRVALLRAGFRIVKLFSPEHGISVTGEDGAFVDHGTDTLTNLPIVSLYGEKMAPAVADLQDIDTVFFDIPDVGARFYTYLWTLTYLMEACAQAGKPLVVLDRPNPTGLQLSQTEGPMLDEMHCSSFIGRWSLPIRHSCTLGELAKYFVATRVPKVQLLVIACKGLTRSCHALLNEEIFVPTSPAIRNARAAFLYPGTGLLEGINVSEGRGTPYPFEWFGAPWIDIALLLPLLQALKIPGISFIPLVQLPGAGPYAGQHCNGLHLNITHAGRYKPVISVITLIRTLLKLYPQHINERMYPTAANPTGTRHLDKLLGVPNAFELLQQETHIETDVAKKWQEAIGVYLLYA